MAVTEGQAQEAAAPRQQATAPRRREVVTSLAEAVRTHVQDGMTVALGGFLTASRPAALAREIVRAGRRNLTVIASPSSFDLDLLIGTGCVRCLIVPYVGAESLCPVAPFFRWAVEQGRVELREVDEGIVLTMLRAARQGHSSLPWRGGVGTSIPVLNPELKVVADPVSGTPVLAVPAVQPDVALIHAAQADPYGNVQHLGNSFADVLSASASRSCVVQVERLVPATVTRQHPELTSIPAHLVSAVVPCPWGAHPFFSQKHYRLDVAHLKEYLGAAEACTRGGDPAPWQAYLDRYVYGAAGHEQYLEAVGLGRLESLREWGARP